MIERGVIEQLLSSLWFHAAAGVSVGVGVMILALAKWGKKLFAPEMVTEESINPTVRAIWDKINEVEGRQITLRGELPKEYVHQDALKKLEDGQTRIETKLDHFMEDCRRGDCAAGRK